MSYVVTGKIETAVALTYISNSLQHGKWSTAPSGTVAAGSSIIFSAENHDGSAIAPQGSATYQAADGTQFTFSFDDPTSEQNSCSTTISNLSGPWNAPTPSYPKGGKTWTVTYYIQRNG